MRRLDEAVRVVDGRNVLLAEEVEELLVLAWVRSRGAAGK